MALFIALITTLVVGLFCGIKKKRNKVVFANATMLFLVATVLIIYSYLYSLSPY